MKRFGWAGLFLLAAFQAAVAAGYDDFSQGISARNRGDVDASIAAFSRAIASSDLVPALQPIAYYDRGTAYLAKGQCAEALSDLDNTVKLRPDYAEAYTTHAYAQLCIGHRDAAIADYTKAIALTPKETLYRARGLVYVHTGKFAEAASDFAQAVKLQPSDIYSALWLHISRGRSGVDDRRDFADLASTLRPHDWPQPVLDLYLGNTTPEKVIADAAQGEAPAPQQQKCEADFYIAEWNVLQEHIDVAKPLFQDAVTVCPHNYVEYGMAGEELSRLK